MPVVVYNAIAHEEDLHSLLGLLSIPSYKIYIIYARGMWATTFATATTLLLLLPVPVLVLQQATGS